MAATDSTNDEPYKLLSIDKAKAPDGTEGDEWFSYRISQGSNLITGYCQGTRSTIKANVEQIIVALNERRAPRRGRVQLSRLKSPSKTSPAS
jgi:hypothetical protein